MPVSVEDIHRFEELNDLSCNVFQYNESMDTNIEVLRKSERKSSKIINLLMIGDSGNRHYILIRSMEALLRSRTRHTGKIHTCSKCFRGFYTKSSYQKHEHYCTTGIPAIEMPKDPIMKFKNYKNSIPNTLIIYADFEAYQMPLNLKAGEKTTLTSQQKPTGFGYMVISPFPKLCHSPKIYRGENAAEKFVEAMHQEYEKVAGILEGEINRDMIYTTEDERIYSSSSTCFFCNESLDWEDKDINPVVRDHCHISGRFRGAAHNNCNINAPLQSKMYIYFHNAKGYDNHLIIEALAANKKTKTIEVVGSTKEKYVQIRTKRFCIHDSMAHLSSGLDTLAASLKKKGEEYFNLVREEFSSDTKFKCCLQKLVYPYDYVTDFKKFEEPIPDIGAFYNKLTEEDLSEIDYQRLMETCKIFDIHTLGQLHDLYLKIDVLLLASVFENYRKVALETFNLDPSYYVR